MTHRCRDCFDTAEVSVGWARSGLERLKVALSHMEPLEFTWSLRISRVYPDEVVCELGITQKTAWFMLHRLRGCTGSKQSIFQGPHDAVEHECKKADQRMCADAIRQPVMNGCDFDVGLQDAETALDIGQRFVVFDSFGGVRSDVLVSNASFPSKSSARMTACSSRCQLKRSASRSALMNRLSFASAMARVNRL